MDALEARKLTDKANENVVMKIFRFGNKFWLEGCFSEAATVYCRTDHKTGQFSFEVNYGAHGDAPPATQRGYARAILAACNYAELCPSIFAGKTPQEIRSIWCEELGEFYRTEEWKENAQVGTSN